MTADTRGGELFFADEPFQQLGGRVPPFHQLSGVGAGHTDQLGHDHHRQAVGHGAHPFDASVAKAVAPGGGRPSR